MKVWVELFNISEFLLGFCKTVLGNCFERSSRLSYLLAELHVKRQGI